MKHLMLLCVLGCSILLLNATGVVIDREDSSFQNIRLSECDYLVEVTNQTAQVKVTETFVNNSGGLIYPRLYFPLPRGASASRLRWNYGEIWNEASITGLPQGTPGGPTHFPDNFVVYIQLMPLVFDAPDSLTAGESIKFEVSYVQLLSYNFGSLTINLKNDYSLIQSLALNRQSLQIDISSTEQITDFDILGVTAQTSHTGYTATGSYTLLGQPATGNYRCVWQLSTQEPLSWGISTKLDVAPDEGPPGFFLYTFREDSLPADSSFALRLNIVIDVSGSMSLEDRLENAKDAACYVIENLNATDSFNVILFDHVVRPLWSSLHPYTDANIVSALDYINGYEMPSLNGTNLYGALHDAISQFITAPAGVKNTILLISDGQPTVGMTDTYQIINSINNQILTNLSDPYIFTFGVGSEVNYQLLSALAQHHHGVSIFLESAEIENTISSFYDEMRNPIFANPSLSLIPGDAVYEVFPDPFPAIYGGMQYRIVGRYSTPQALEIELSGLHNGVSYTYDYLHTLSNEANTVYSFIPKLWASAKIDKLLIEYYSHPPTSPQAIALREQIIGLSIDFGVVCVFTSFVDDPPTENDDDVLIPVCPVKLLQNHPNPFNPSTTISFEVAEDMNEEAELRIYNMKGQLVYVAKIQVNGKGLYRIMWNGIDLRNLLVSSGVYVYSIRCGKYLLHSRMTLIK